MSEIELLKTIAGALLIIGLLLFLIPTLIVIGWIVVWLFNLNILLGVATVGMLALAIGGMVMGVIEIE